MQNTAPVFGAAVMGSLRYHDDTHAWLVEVGQVLAVYELLSTSPNADPVVLKNRLEAIQFTNRSLAAKGVPFSIVEDNVIRRRQAAADLSTILRLIKMIFGPPHCAFILIGSCTCILRQAPPLISEDPTVRETLYSTARSRLEEIQIQCPGLSISPSLLWRSVECQPFEGLTTPGVRRLLCELSKPLKILVISADPSNASHLRLSEERRELEDALRKTRFRDSFEVHDMPSCRVRDITRALDDHQPTIVQFSGHGNPRGLCLENMSGRIQVVDKTALARLFQHQPGLMLVILNACYSRDQAQCIADSVGHVIAMDGPIRDRHAIDFTRELYAALGFGRSFEDGFQRAKAAMGLENSSTIRPFLLKRGAEPLGDGTNGTMAGGQTFCRRCRSALGFDSLRGCSCILLALTTERCQLKLLFYVAWGLLEAEKPEQSAYWGRL